VVFWLNFFSSIFVYIYIDIQWNLCNPTPEFSDILWHSTKIYGPKVFLLTKIKPKYSGILYIPTHFHGPLVCRIRQVPLYIQMLINPKNDYSQINDWYFFPYTIIFYMVMVFNTTFNNISAISWRSVLLVEKIGVTGLEKNHWHVASLWQTLSHNVVSSTPRHELDSNSQR